MTVGGWITLLCSLSFVWGLAIWCYYMVLKDDEPPAEALEKFHSA